MAANLTNEMNSPDKFAHYLDETRMMGIEIAPPSINNSDMKFTVVDNKIVYGLQGIKNVGEGAVESILKERQKGGPYTSFLDFLRSEVRAVNSKLLESLILAGHLMVWGQSPHPLSQYGAALKYVQRRREDIEQGKALLTTPMRFSWRP